MVEKPNEGICSKCGAESLEFYDDGSGRCVNCGRTFHWASEEELKQSQGQPKKQRTTDQYERSSGTKQRSSQPSQGTSRETSQRSSRQQTMPAAQGKSKSRSNGYTRSKPSRAPPSSSEKSKSSRGFLYIALIGFIVTIVGYVLLSITTMGFELEMKTVQLLRGLYILLSSSGVLVVGLGLVHGAVTADDLHEKIRSWMLLAMALLLGLYLSFNLAFNIGMMGSILG